MTKKYQLGLYEKALPNNLTIEEKLVLAKKCGYDFLELSIDDTELLLSRLDMTKKELNSLKALMAKEDFYIQSISFTGHKKYPLGSEDKKIRHQGNALTLKVVDLAYKLGTRYIQIAGYDSIQSVESEESRSCFVKNMKKIVDYASKKGVIISFETMENKFMDTVAKTMQFIEEINSPFLQIYPDIGNLANAAHNYKSNEIADLRLGKGHIIAADIKETLPLVYKNLNYGEGHTNHVRYLTELVKQNVFTYVAKFWDNGNANFEDRVISCRMFIEKKINDAWSVRNG